MYKKKTEQLYCPQCEQYLADRYVIGKCLECGEITRGDQCENCSAMIEAVELKDRAVSKDLDWGIEVPIEGYSQKKVYVWVEAVLGYLTAAIANLRNLLQPFYPSVQQRLLRF